MNGPEILFENYVTSPQEQEYFSSFYNQRKQYRRYRPSYGEIDEAFATMLHPYHDHTLVVINDQYEAVTKKLAETKERLEGHLGKEISIPALSMQYISQEVLHDTFFSPWAQKRAEKFPPQFFVPWYDFTTGVLATSSLIFTGEAEIAGNFETFTKKFQTGKQTAQEMFIPEDFSKQSIQSIRQVGKAAEKSLIHDPTGLSLLDSYVFALDFRVKHGVPINQPPFVQSYQIGPYVIAGAIFTRDVYQQLYSLAARVSA